MSFLSKGKKSNWKTKLLIVLSLNWFGITCFAELAQGINSLIGIELFTNQKSTNNSGSTYQHPLAFDSQTIDHHVDFTVSGEALAKVNLVNGNKDVILIIPEDLRGRVKARGEAQVEVDVLLSEGAPLIGSLIKALTVLLLPLTSGRPELTRLVGRLTNLGQLNYTTPIFIHEDGEYMIIDYKSSLAKAIVENLKATLSDIQKIIKEIPLLGLLLGTLTSSINNLLNVILNATQEDLNMIVDTAVLSKTEVTFPTTISNNSEEFYGDENGIIAQDFYMGIVSTALIDVDLFKNSQRVTTVFFEGKKTVQKATIGMPEKLNFGTHKIQTLKDEKWIATETGNQTEAPTTGKIVLVDTTLGAKKWEIKVKQSSQWGSQSATLGEPVLKIYGGEFSYLGFEQTEIAYFSKEDGQSLDLIANQEQVILNLNPTDLRGQIEFKLDKFELIVPKNYPKREGVYRTVFIWTSSNGP